MRAEKERKNKRERGWGGACDRAMAVTTLPPRGSVAHALSIHFHRPAAYLDSASTSTRFDLTGGWGGQELKKFLDEKVSAGELAFSAGEYQLPSG